MDAVLAEWTAPCRTECTLTRLEMLEQKTTNSGLQQVAGAILREVRANRRAEEQV